MLHSAKSGKPILRGFAGIPHGNDLSLQADRLWNVRFLLHILANARRKWGSDGYHGEGDRNLGDRAGRLVSMTNRNACLVHIYPTGPGMGLRYPLADTPLVLGRGNDCDIRINDHSVSRRHARIQPGADGYYAVDLQSTNGTFVNDVPASMCKLKDGDYLRVGNCIYRFLAGGNVEAEYHEEIYRLTIIDALTDIHNKRYLLEFLDRELSRSARYDRPLSLIMFDIDRFKADQRRAGPPRRRLHAARAGRAHQGQHPQGRAVRPLRRRGVRGRAAGNAAAKAPSILAERLLQVVSQQPFQYEDKTFAVTISVGVATTAGEKS